MGKYLWWFEGIICREVNGEEKDTTGIWTVGLNKSMLVHIQKIGRLNEKKDIGVDGERMTYRSHDGCLPMKLLSS